MADQQNFYKSPLVAEWLDTIPARRKSRAINAALERDIQQQAERETDLTLLREAVSALHNLHTVFLELVSEVAQIGRHQ